MRPINELVDELRDPDGRGWMPYVAPVHGGVNARVLSILRDPGPKTQDGTGSGYLCIENDDATAEQQYLAFQTAGIDVHDLMPWNAYPWYINRKPTAAELDAGVEPLVRLLDLLPRLTVVLLQGGDARSTWHRLTRRRPDLVADRHLTVIGTHHPGRQALWSADPAVREQRQQHRLDAYQQVAGALCAR
ncbi:uracil-DNA glycosylase [Dactylosporangium sp. NBC_01737]|uniref:uracil-DNA glycosylase n=1 Tax=Dactylosporangium sp. NBC_01737 TaxID=2975959 RepID=UPI002E1021E8|nr:uracil-DNA glycosylase [Dactylosporangium sp. NBC_01737]